MKLLVIGSTGMLGQALVKECKKRGIEVIGLARKNADISCDISDAKGLCDAILQAEPDIIINAAALVNLYLCEKEPGYAYLVNARPVSYIADFASRMNKYFIQISTDHYFTDGTNSKHTEEHPVRLVNEYARTKYVAEMFALTSNNSLVVRTNIVGFRKNSDSNSQTFVEWAIEHIEKDLPMTLFSDYFTSSIHVEQFSSILFDIIDKKYTGVLNIASSDVSSKKDFVMRLAEKMGCVLTNTEASSIKGLTNTTRAESLGLDVKKAETILGRDFPTLDEVIEKIIKEYRRL